MTKKSLFFFLALTACSSISTERTPAPPARSGIDVPSFCNQYINICQLGEGATISTCEGGYTAVRVSPDCAKRIDAATCAELGDESATGLQAQCFPACTVAGGTCNPDGTIDTCSGTPLTLTTFDCAALCMGSGQTWAGKCDGKCECQ